MASIHRWSLEMGRRPFAAGMVLPLLFPRLVSRSLWWTTAALTAISGIINIRLIWGFWASPFTEIVLGFALGLFCLGLWTPADRTSRGRSDDVPPLAVVSTLALAIIGCPLLANVMAQGWVRIPKAAAGLIGPVFFLVMLSPALFVAICRRRIDKGQAAALEAEAVRRWEAYVSTGTLPEAAKIASSGD